MSYKPRKERPARPPRSDANPEGIWVTDGETGDLVALTPDKFPEVIRPAIWFENVFWRTSGYLTEDQVMTYFRQEPLEKDDAYKIAKYILLYAQNMACASWLFCEPTGRESYLTFITPCILRLNAIMRDKPITRKQLKAMIEVCLNFTIDPF